eukprot:gene27460-36237_t
MSKLVWSEELNDFLSALELYNSTFPDALSKSLLERKGVSVEDDKISKFISLAADKFMSEVIYEAKQISILRQQSTRSLKRKAEMADTLELEDLEGSVSQMRIQLRRKKLKLPVNNDINKEDQQSSDTTKS